MRAFLVVPSIRRADVLYDRCLTLHKMHACPDRPKELLYPYMSRLRARAIRGSRRDLTRRPGRHAGYALSMRRTASQVELTDGIVLVRNR